MTTTSTSICYYEPRAKAICTRDESWFKTGDVMNMTISNKEYGGPQWSRHLSETYKTLEDAQNDVKYASKCGWNFSNVFDIEIIKVYKTVCTSIIEEIVS